MSDAATTVYGLRNCDACRAARRWLESRGLAHRFVDIRRDGLDAARVEAWADRLGTDALVNRRSRTWRQLPEDERARDEPGLRALLLREPTLIRRPVIETAGGALHAGWDERVRAALEEG